jgi:hypothetical protein
MSEECLMSRQLAYRRDQELEEAERRVTSALLDGGAMRDFVQRASVGELAEVLSILAKSLAPRCDEVAGVGCDEYLEDACVAMGRLAFEVAASHGGAAVLVRKLRPIMDEHLKGEG